MGALLCNSLFLFSVSVVLGQDTRYEDNLSSARKLNNLAAEESSRGEFLKAEADFQATLERERETPNLEFRASVLHNLASVYWSRARYVEAEAVFRQAIAAREQLFGAEDFRLVLPMQGLSATLLAQGKLRAAEQIAQRAIGIGSKADGHPTDLAISQTYLVNALIGQSRFDEAIAIAQNVLKNLEQASLTETVAYGETLNALGITYRNQARYPQAKDYLTRAIALFERVIGDENQVITVARNNLGQVMSAQGKSTEALALFERASAFWRSRYGEHHPDIATCFTNMAGVYAESKRLDKAEALLKQALEIDTEVLGPQNPKVALDFNNLGSLASRRNRFSDAESFLKRALAIYEESNAGRQSYETGLVSGNLAVLYFRRHRFLKAEPLFRRAIQVREQIFGADDETLARLLEGYVVALRVNKKFSEAAVAETRAIGIRTRRIMANEKGEKAATAFVN